VGGCGSYFSSRCNRQYVVLIVIIMIAGKGA
jgi:hypothetical protein